jgi:mycothiol synthase
MSTNQPKTEIIDVPDALAIPGLRFRRFQGEADFPRMVAVYNECMAADGVDAVTTVERVASFTTPDDHFDPIRDMVFAVVEGEPDDGVVGYSHIVWFEDNQGNVIHQSSGCVLPRWRRKGLGGAMLRHNEALMRRAAAERLRDKSHLFETIVSESNVGGTALVLREGYQPVIYFAVMVRPNLENVPEAPMPKGLEVRPVAPEHYRAIWEASEEAMLDNWEHVPGDEEDYHRWLNHPIEFQPELWKVAWDGDEVVGQVRSYIDEAQNQAEGRNRGYTEYVSVRRPWRKRGLARALLVQSLKELKARSMTEASLDVNTDNPRGAFALYESVGFQTTRVDVLYQKPMSTSNTSMRGSKSSGRPSREEIAAHSRKQQSRETS